MITNEKIKNINKAIRNNSESLKSVLSNYKNNIEKINTNLKGIDFSDWDDGIALKFTDYKNYLTTGVVTKLNSSIAANGSEARLNYLITDLYNKCNAYLTNYNSIQSKDSSLVPDGDGFTSISEEESNHYTKDQVDVINRRLKEDRDIIENVYNELSSLRFDTIVNYSGSQEINTYSDLSIPTQVKKTTTLVQFDKVLIAVGEDQTLQEMYYLGTDSKGRSYFAPSLDQNALVYRAELPEEVKGFTSYLNDPEYLAKPGFAEARMGALLFGDNLGEVRVKDILQEFNGLYTEDANFNTSITYHDSTYAPEVIEHGENTYDPERAYHVMNIDKNLCVSLSQLFDEGSGNLIDSHPNIILKPGEKITTKYNVDLGLFEIGFLKDSYTIGSDDSFVILSWDEDKQLYYVLNDNGSYSTASFAGGKNYGRGYRYIRAEQLTDPSTKIDLK